MVKHVSLLILVFGFCASDIFSQAADASVTESNLYATALSACLAKEAESYAKLGTSNRVDYEKRVVERNIHLTDDLPTLFGKIKVEYLDSEMLRLRYEKTRREIPVMELRPMRNEGSTLKISIGNYWFRYKNKSYNYGRGGGCNVEFKFDSTQNVFALAKIYLR